MKPSIRPLASAATLSVLLLAFAAEPVFAERPPLPERRGSMRFDRAYSREQSAIKKAISPVVADAARATHRVLFNGKHTALATAVHSDGWLLTKASEIDPTEKLEIEFPEGLRLPATVTDRLDAYDLALLKVDATGLKPVTWSDRPVPRPGSFLAAPGPTGGVAALGVSSVGPRNLYETPKGYMGVRLSESGSPVIEKVVEGGAADEAGLKPEDIILAVDGVAVGSRESLVAEVTRHRPGHEITLKIKRGEEEIEIRLTLMNRSESLDRFARERDPMVLMSGRLSRHRRSFFNVFQHDLVLTPEECGGPLVDLDGHVVGLDIARSGRVESLAIPAADIKNLLSQVTTGKFALPDLDALREELKKAELGIRTAQEAREQAEIALKRAHDLHATLPSPPASPTTAVAAEAAPEETPTAPTMPVQAAEPAAEPGAEPAAEPAAVKP